MFVDHASFEVGQAPACIVGIGVGDALPQEAVVVSLTIAGDDWSLYIFQVNQRYYYRL